MQKSLIAPGTGGLKLRCKESETKAKLVNKEQNWKECEKTNLLQICDLKVRLAL